MAFNKDEREVLQRARDFQDLVHNPAWKLLEKLIQTRVQAEVNQMTSAPPRDADGNMLDGMMCTKLEDRQKGAIFGMLLTIGLPQATIEQAKQLAMREASSDEPATDGNNEHKLAP